jgi:hypothetical protein
MDIFEQIKDLLKERQVLFRSNEGDKFIDTKHFTVRRRTMLDGGTSLGEVITINLGGGITSVTMTKDLSDEELLFLNMQGKTQFVNHKDFLSALERLIE